MEITETLKQRGSIYGKYEVGAKGIANIMKELNKIHLDKNGTDLSETNKVDLYFIVMKLVRVAATPNHIDSWHDISGYAKLIEQTKEKK